MELTQVLGQYWKLIRGSPLVIQLHDDTYISCVVSDLKLGGMLEAQVGGDGIGHFGIHSTIWVRGRHLENKEKREIRNVTKV